MDAFTDSRIKELTIVACAQLGKTEAESNMIGYMIDQDPGPAMLIMPTNDMAEDFSKRRFAPMVRDTKPLREKVSTSKSRESTNTISKKVYQGGMLTMVGANSPAPLRGIPGRYVFGDEIDAWPKSAGTEGDPWGLVRARTTTFYNSKMVAVSTPTIKGSSKIAELYDQGTREKWCVRCPDCGEYSFIDFDSIKFEYHHIEAAGKKKQFIVDSVGWACPKCGVYFDEKTVKKQPMKWIAESPEAIQNGRRSFWINGFSSPWLKWADMVTEFLEAGKDPEKLKVVFNTKFGELWEQRTDLEDEDELAARAEEYPAELPEGVLVLTCGVDTQDNRLEYEVVGYGLYEENWGIEKGIIMGNPANPETWQKLDAIIDREWSYEDGHKLKISLTFVDEGGHYTQEVRENCSMRQSKKVFAIKGANRADTPYTSPAKIGDYLTSAGHAGKYWYFMIGVDSGKEHIMSGLKVREPGARMSHFPSNWGRGYDALFYSGLLSETMVMTDKGGWKWEKLPGHERNEALDCRNYANAAFRVLHPNMEALREQRFGINKPVAPAQSAQKRQRIRRSVSDEW